MSTQCFRWANVAGGAAGNGQMLHSLPLLASLSPMKMFALFASVCEICLPASPALSCPTLPCLQCAPSEDELKLLRSFLEAGGQQSALADSERFAWLLGQVPRLGPRLRCLLFQYEAPQQLQVCTQCECVHTCVCVHTLAACCGCGDQPGSCACAPGVPAAPHGVSVRRGGNAPLLAPWLPPCRMLCPRWSATWRRSGS
jgi:hypothetical protein